MKEEKIKMFMDMFEEAMFFHVPSVLPKYVGDIATRVLLFNVLKNAAKDTMGQMAKNMGLSLKESIEEFFKSFGEVGMPFEFEVRDRPFSVIVKSCPHERFTLKNPLGCVVCISMLAGLVEGLTGKKVSVISDKGKLGDPKAEVRLRLNKFKPGGDEVCEIIFEE